MTTGTMLVGVDIAKRVHHVCLVEQHGGQVGRGFTVPNTKQGLDAFCARVDKEAAARGLRPVVRVEATGVYSWPFVSALEGRYEVQIFHPLQLKGAKEHGIRKTKNDRVDARTLATTSKQPPSTDYSDRVRLQIRELGRYREKLGTICEAQWKRLIRNVFVTFPGLDDQYEMDTVWMRALLAEFHSPGQVVDAGEAEIARVIREANGRASFAQQRAADVVGFCRECLTTEFVGHVLGLVNKQILARIAQLERDVAEVDNEIVRLWSGVEAGFAYHHVEGMDAVTAALVYGELGRLTRYADEDKVVAAAGLDPVSWQSGQGKVRVGRISKQGSPVVRRVLTRKVLGMRKTNPVIRDYYAKKTAEGKPYKVALTASAKRLLRLLWNVEHKHAKNKNE